MPDIGDTCFLSFHHVQHSSSKQSIYGQLSNCPEILSTFVFLLAYVEGSINKKCRCYFGTITKQKLQTRLVQLMQADNADIHLIDGFPIDVVVRTTAPRSKVFKGEEHYGFCASRKKHFYNFKGHLLVEA